MYIFSRIIKNKVNAHVRIDEFCVANETSIYCDSQTTLTIRPISAFTLFTTLPYIHHYRGPEVIDYLTNICLLTLIYGNHVIALVKVK